MSTPTATSMAEDEIDLRELFLALWEKKHIIAASAIIGLVLAAIYAFLIAKPVYESSALLLPTQTNNTDQLGAAAALLGKKSSSNADVELYQSLLTSRTVIHKLLKSPIISDTDSNRAQTVLLYSILKIDTSNPLQVDATIRQLTSSINVNSKESGESGILEIRFESNSAWLAQQIGNQLLAIGQEEMRLVRIARSDIILDRLSRAVGQARKDWDSTARIATLYKDRNRSIALPEQILEISRLEMEKSAMEQKYLLARKEYEALKLEREKAAPPMMILDPANLPSHKSRPLRGLILLAGFAIATITSGVSILVIRFMVRTPRIA